MHTLLGGYEVSAAQEKRDLAEYEAMSDNKKNGADLDHRRAHAGQQYLASKLIHSDHCWRALSLLHLMLNTVGSTLTTVVVAGATTAERAAINATLEEKKHQWRLKDKKSVFEKKPAGNECRQFLWGKGNVLLQVLRTHRGNLSIKDISSMTAIKTEDIISTLQVEC